jgi:hypothetical protein
MVEETVGTTIVTQNRVSGRSMYRLEGPSITMKCVLSYRYRASGPKNSSPRRNPVSRAEVAHYIGGSPNCQPKRYLDDG